MLMNDLFGENSNRHDAGGKVRTRLLPGVQGGAVFAGDRDQYRPLLTRWRGQAFPARYVLFLGMNPSAAEAEFNDPTIAREWDFADRWGFDGLVKVNVSDWRATDQDDLSKVGESLFSSENYGTIMEMAEGAAKVVVAHGKLPKPLQMMGATIIAALRASEIDLWCFAKNKDGSPKHSLYVAGSTELIPY